MTFENNNRISHRQFYRQLILTFTAPFLLCLFQEKRLSGVMGMTGTIAAILLLLLYVIFLIRLAPQFENLQKSCGGVIAGLIGCFFLSYTLLTSAYLVELLAKVVPISLLEGVSEVWIRLLAILVCAHGSYRGMQRRGRMAEVSGGLLLCIVFLMMLLSFGQAKGAYLQEMLRTSPKTITEFWKNGYGVLCAFSGIGLLPFVLPHVEKSASAWKPAAYGILTVGAILEGMLFLLPAVFGWKRLQEEAMPILPLLSGTNLPGKILARFDVLWMGFVIYGLLYSLGSLFHYSHQILELVLQNPTERKSNRWQEHTGRWNCKSDRKKQLGQWTTFFLELLVFFLSIIKWDGKGIEAYFFPYLGTFFLPGMLLIQMGMFWRGNERRKKRMVAGLFTLAVLFLSGCAGGEPEKRMYPLAMGVQDSDGVLSVCYGMPNLPKTTGQGKSEAGESDSTIIIEGTDFSEIEKKYNQTQEKYMDLGHLQVVILENQMFHTGTWRKVLEYLKKEKMVGEDIYVFRAEKPAEILAWQNQAGTSVGEYLVGILENDNVPKVQNAVTLREVYHDWYEKNQLSELPLVKVEGDFLKIQT